MAWKSKGMYRYSFFYPTSNANSHSIKNLVSSAVIKLTLALSYMVVWASVDAPYLCTRACLWCPLQAPLHLFLRHPYISSSLQWDSCLLSCGKWCSSTVWCSMTNWWTSSVWRQRWSRSFWVPVRELSSSWASEQGWGLSLITDQRCQDCMILIHVSLSGCIRATFHWSYFSEVSV